MRRAVITGSSIVSSIGNNQQKVLTFLREGYPGITFSRELENSGMRSHVWDNVKLDTIGLIDHKIVRFMSDASIYAFLSMEQAIADTGLSPGAYQNNPRVNLIAGSDGGPPRFQVFGADTMRDLRDPKAVDPCAATKAMVSGASACLTTPFKTHDVNYSISSACATSTHCIGGAIERIQLGKQDIAFAGDDEELCWKMTYEFDAMGVLSAKYNDTPEEASRTYDAHRDGFVITGDDGIVAVEELEHALAHSAHIYAEIVGYGTTSDGANVAAPSSKGIVRCIKMAMHGVDTPIDYLNSHGASTPVNDVKKLAAARGVFDGKSPATSATKAMTGHSLDAAGAQEAIYSLLILEHGLTTPSVNIKEPDEQVAGLNIMIETTDRELTAVMSNSFSFDGISATLVMRRPKG